MKHTLIALSLIIGLAMPNFSNAATSPVGGAFWSYLMPKNKTALVCYSIVGIAVASICLPRLFKYWFKDSKQSPREEVRPLPDPIVPDNNTDHETVPGSSSTEPVTPSNTESSIIAHSENSVSSNATSQVSVLSAAVALAKQGMLQKKITHIFNQKFGLTDTPEDVKRQKHLHEKFVDLSKRTSSFMHNVLNNHPLIPYIDRFNPQKDTTMIHCRLMNFEAMDHLMLDILPAQNQLNQGVLTAQEIDTIETQYNHLNNLIESFENWLKHSHLLGNAQNPTRTWLLVRANEFYDRIRGLSVDYYDIRNFSETISLVRQQVECQNILTQEQKLQLQRNIDNVNQELDKYK